jgi:hypothetical protein
MLEPRLLKVFLCHSSNDKPAVRELYQKLSAEAWIDPWLDEEKLFPGQDWNLEIEKAVEAADAILVCLSNNSITKEGYVQRELRIVLDYADYKPEGTLYLIPVRLEDCAPPRRLRPWQYADYFPPERRDWAWGRLLISLKMRAEALGISVGQTDISSHTPTKKTNLAIKEKGSSFIKYDGLTLEEDTDGAHFGQYVYIGAGLATEVKLWVIVHNMNKYVYDCQVILDNFEFCGSDQNAVWENAYRGFDRKAMKWDVGYIPNEGKIELDHNAKKVLEIAKATRDTGMQLSHLDGYSTRNNNLNGKYRVTFIVYGKVLVNDIKKPIKDLRYRIAFKYEQGPLLKIIEMERI